MGIKIVLLIVFFAVMVGVGRVAGRRYRDLRETYRDRFG